MTFNVENLFDATHDPGKNDITYLPISEKQSQAHIDECNRIDVEYWRVQCLYWDWNETVVQQKLAAVGAAIRQVNGGRGPDIIALQEVENEAILQRLRDEELAGLGYQSIVLLEGRDYRGIDVAFLARFPAVNPQHHEIDMPASMRRRLGDTRPVLQADFQLPNGDILTGFAVHFPAPSHPTVMREHAYTTLNRLLAALPPGQVAFAAGDFNTTSAEDREQAMLDRWVRPYWEIAHELCTDCPGSSYYARTGEWSFLDMILWRPAVSWEIASSSLANNSAEQMRFIETDAGDSMAVPKRFNLPQATGVSDHWPLVMVIERRDH